MQNPEELLEELCKNADPRKVKSLRLIYKICKEQHDRGSKDYSVATIGKLSAEAGGPGEGAIRNPTGEVYRALVQAYADSVGGQKKKLPVAAGDEANQVLEGINDPVLRTRIHLLLAELRSLRGQLDAARHLANKTVTVELGTGAKLASTDSPPAETLSLTDTERRSLRRSIDKETMVHWGWTVDGSGRVVSDSGQAVFGPGFISAVTKILKFIE